MALYTMELRTLVNDPYCEIFGFDYPFYTVNKKAKEDFEELFINHFYYHEIGCETFTRWQQMLKARLMLRMPYYAQLYQTEWHQTQKDMMLSKSLVETLTKEITLEGSNESTQASSGTQTTKNEQSQSGTDTVTNEQSQSGTSTSSSTSEGSTSTKTSTKESSINDGVALVNLETANLTHHSEQETTGESSATSSGTSTDEQELTGSQNSTSSSEMSSNSENSNNLQSSLSGTNQSKQIETQTFVSEGDVGIQTPAYAIAEWRKIIINLNEMIIHDLEDLFMQIY